MKRHLVTTAIFVLLVSACASAVPTPQADSPAIPLEDCVLTTPGFRTQVEAQCGTLSVFEDPDAQAGRQIALYIAVLPAVSRNAEADPLFLLAGGPGQAATETYVSLEPAFRQINRDRDIVLVDQRGTGQSHPLRCELPEELSLDFEADLDQPLRECLNELDADPRLYTTTIAMQDLDQVRQALGYEQINIYGVSYGTRAALVYLRLYPDRVRALILDGVAPPQLTLGPAVATDAQNALDQILERCAVDDMCSTSFPDLDGHVQNILSALEVAPRPVRLNHPVTGEPVELEFSREMFATVLRFHSYSPETAALLPLLIHTAATRQDYSLLASQFLMLAGSFSESLADGMSYSVQCAEDVPFFEREVIQQANQNTYLGNLVTDGLLEVCETWPRGEIPPDFKQPVASEVPVLLLSGEFDPITPPAYAELAAETLPNSLHLIIPGQGHNVILRGCVPKIATAFIQSGSIQGLETSCLQTIQPFPFFITFSGPQP